MTTQASKGVDNAPENDADARHVPDLSGYSQGDVVSLPALPVMEDSGQITSIETPHGAVILTQTCDLVLTDRPTVHLAPVAHLSEGAAKLARSGRQPSLVHIPELGEHAFADLTFIGTLRKGAITDLPKTSGVKSDEDVRKFGQRIGRRFSRFAFPDSVVPWIRPLRAIVESRHGKAASPAGWALDRVATLRLESFNGWIEPPFEITLCIVLEPRVFPTFPSDYEPKLSKELDIWLHGAVGEIALKRKHGEIAERLMKGGDAIDPDSRWWLWSALADAWANLCIPPAGSDPEVLSAVDGGEFSADILSADEFPYSRLRRTEEIDLDHLSLPLPI
ncbi:hypothetical protein [Kitasatospora fiedleri]|uniref:hypothetical protein n=1 Tax=Kitasatospora fiedleri TaxID=2991545 RepID=UPI00249A398B|nr:hypothetical protein [Kitasatospora fiedleri]